MKLLLFVFLFAFANASPGYSDSSPSGNDISEGNAQGSSFGYSGSFAGAGVPGGNFPAFPAFPQFDFSGFFTNYLEALNKQHQEFINQGGGISYAYAFSSPGSSAMSQSSISFSNNNAEGLQKLAQTQGQTGGSYAPNYQGGGGVDLGNRGGFVGGYGGGFSGPDGQSFSFSGPIGADSGAAFASGSIGPGGGFQTAAVYPENPASPNVNTRFGASGGGPGGGDFKSVFTSSKSVTSNVDGKPQTFRQASTTVNDNGKVTTYTAQNP
ncbi:glycine-rich cell wall structural protein 1.8 isoform X1 [Sitophilus oryzae]|uniref:Glycine-rich cell wall structural protein 1.8 isoform X1 n=1 Tax=Sitophilus oryzae TaxID=7048 RepID=A0A6J2XYJ3_SITOR|nr:glycine-rich cell wall structural protein 1.8 isoform X1 [Sitophilus oryzae]